jgi:hypothetical protein
LPVNALEFVLSLPPQIGSVFRIKEDRQPCGFEEGGETLGGTAIFSGIR